MDIKGRIHSIETCGTSDGPGIRFVVFTQGCPLRCQYCHNPDTWRFSEGEEVTVEEIMKEIMKYKSYIKSSNGGVTISGGEPLMQPEFTKELLKKCKEAGIHTALDTSGYSTIEKAKEVLEYSDLVLLDIKAFDMKRYKTVTGVMGQPTIDMVHYLSGINKPVWIRYVLVPGLTDNYEEIEELAVFLSSLDNIERIDILPFHKMGEYKWDELGYDYKLKDTLPPSREEIKRVKELFMKYNLKAN